MSCPCNRKSCDGFCAEKYLCLPEYLNERMEEQDRLFDEMEESDYHEGIERMRRDTDAAIDEASEEMREFKQTRKRDQHSNDNECGIFSDYDPRPYDVRPMADGYVCGGTCEPMCSTCDRLADEAAANMHGGYDDRDD